VRDVLAARSELHRGGRFGDEVAGAWSKDVDAEHPIGLPVREHLDAAFCVAECPGASAGTMEFC